MSESASAYFDQLPLHATYGFLRPAREIRARLERIGQRSEDPAASAGGSEEEAAGPAGHARETPQRRVWQPEGLTPDSDPQLEASLGSQLAVAGATPSFSLSAEAARGERLDSSAPRSVELPPIPGTGSRISESPGTREDPAQWRPGWGQARSSPGVQQELRNSLMTIGRLTQENEALREAMAAREGALLERQGALERRVADLEEDNAGLRKTVLELRSQVDSLLTENRVLAAQSLVSQGSPTRVGESFNGEAPAAQESSPASGSPPSKAEGDDGRGGERPATGPIEISPGEPSPTPSIRPAEPIVPPTPPSPSGSSPRHKVNVFGGLQNMSLSAVSATPVPNTAKASPAGRRERLDDSQWRSDLGPGSGHSGRADRTELSPPSEPSVSPGIYAEIQNAQAQILYVPGSPAMRPSRKAVSGTSGVSGVSGVIGENGAIGEARAVRAAYQRGHEASDRSGAWGGMSVVGGEAGSRKPRSGATHERREALDGEPGPRRDGDGFSRMHHTERADYTAYTNRVSGDQDGRGDTLPQEDFRGDPRDTLQETIQPGTAIGGPWGPRDVRGSRVERSGAFSTQGASVGASQGIRGEAPTKPPPDDSAEEAPYLLKRAPCGVAMDIAVDQPPGASNPDEVIARLQRRREEEMERRSVSRPKRSGVVSATPRTHASSGPGNEVDASGVSRVSDATHHSQANPTIAPAPAPAQRPRYWSARPSVKVSQFQTQAQFQPHPSRWDEIPGKAADPLHYYPPQTFDNSRTMAQVVRTVALPGTPNYEKRTEVLDQLAGVKGHVMLVFREEERKAYYACVVVTPEGDLRKVSGPPQMPDLLPQERIEFMFKYDSAARGFVKLNQTSLSMLVGGVTLKFKRAVRSAARR